MPARNWIRVTDHKGARSKVAEEPSWLNPITFTTITASPPQTIAASNPHNKDFHQAHVPKPTELRGSFSPRLTTRSSAMTLANMTNSRVVSRAVPGAGLTMRNTCLISGRAKRAMHKTIHVLAVGRVVLETGAARG